MHVTYSHTGLEWGFKAIFVMLWEIYKMMPLRVGVKGSFQIDFKNLNEKTVKELWTFVIM